MGLAQRKDLGVRAAFEKGRKADEGITRSQIQPGRNVYFDYLPNWDIRINAIAAGAAAGGVRNLVAYVKAKLRPQHEEGRGHFDVQDESTGDGIVTHHKQFYGTALFVDVYHNWNLPSKDHFTFSIEDLREQYYPSKIDFSAMKSMPHVVGVDVNRVRIWATDCMVGTRSEPRFWVDTDGEDNMTNTRLADRTDSAPQDLNPFKHLSEDTIELAPFYAIKIYEITDVNAVVNQWKSNDTVI